MGRGRPAVRVLHACWWVWRTRDARTVGDVPRGAWGLTRAAGMQMQMCLFRRAVRGRSGRANSGGHGCRQCTEADDSPAPDQEHAVRRTRCRSPLHLHCVCAGSECGCGWRRSLDQRCATRGELGTRAGGVLASAKARCEGAHAWHRGRATLVGWRGREKVLERGVERDRLGTGAGGDAWMGMIMNDEGA